MSLRSIAASIGIIVLLGSGLYFAFRHSAPAPSLVIKSAVLDEDGYIEGQMPLLVEFGAGDQLSVGRSETTFANLKKGLDRPGRNEMPMPILIVADENVAESRVAQIVQLFAEHHFSRICRIRAYPDRPMQNAENPSLAAPSVQAAKFKIIASETGLTFPPSARIVEFVKGTYIDAWWTKILVPESAFPTLKQAVENMNDTGFHDPVAEWWSPRWWITANPEFTHVGSRLVYAMEIKAVRENGTCAIYLACETR